MKSILCFTLVFIVFGSIGLFAMEQLEEEKFSLDRSMDSVSEDMDIKKDLKQGLSQSIIQQRNNLESIKSEVDKLNVEKVQNIKTGKGESKEELQHDKNKTSILEKAMSEIGRNSEDLSELSDDLLKENRGEGDEVTPDLPNVTDKEVNGNLIFSPSVSLSENVTDLQKDLQVNKKVDVEKNKPSENNIDKLLEGKKLEGQVRKEKVKKLSKSHNIEKPILKKDEKSKQEKEKNLQRLAKLNNESVKKWHHRNTQDELIYKRQYSNLNQHLPATIFVDDYSKRLFYCIKKNNLVCLRGIINKLEKLGLTVQEVLKFRNKLGDTPLIYAVKQGGIDIVRFFLLQGADPKVVNYNLQSPIDIAIERERVDMINAIAEMMPYFLEYKK
ncbi:ankyrin repeat domain-containing protein [Wolbachia endosymbiont of Onchocerca volvulus]|uniref:ankyrin repeat domain-containing protein n=1 Tax=Onchocerca volvulus endobacterium TaxID=77551 RepID=UPI0009DEE779|nr:ankyrin repeat domain-containing protein [Wolbachia endosymbiont of Onchocerca volvulus]